MTSFNIPVICPSCSMCSSNRVTVLALLLVAERACFSWCLSFGLLGRAWGRFSLEDFSAVLISSLVALFIKYKAYLMLSSIKILSLSMITFQETRVCTHYITTAVLTNLFVHYILRYGNNELSKMTYYQHKWRHRVAQLVEHCTINAI